MASPNKYKARVMTTAQETGRSLLPLGEALNDVPQNKVKKPSKRKPSHKSTYRRRDMKAET